MCALGACVFYFWIFFFKYQLCHRLKRILVDRIDRRKEINKFPEMMFPKGVIDLPRG